MSDRIIRVAKGDSLPENVEFKQWLGVEPGMLYFPSYEADVLLVSDVTPTSVTSDLGSLPESVSKSLPGVEEGTE